MVITIGRLLKIISIFGTFDNASKSAARMGWLICIPQSQIRSDCGKGIIVPRPRVRQLSLIARLIFRHYREIAKPHLPVL